MLRIAGYPAPAIELAVEHDGVVVLVWQLMPGRGVDRVTGELLDQALVLNASQRGALVGRDDVPLVQLHLGSSGPGFCLHEPLVTYSRRTADLLDWVRSVGTDHGDVLRGDDAVHYDFQPTNLLADDGAITAVVDWDGAGRGDARLDLVTLRFGVEATSSGDDIVRRLDLLLDAMPPEVLRPAWAHMSLRMVDWSIRHHDEHRTRRWLDLAMRRTG